MSLVGPRPLLLHEIGKYGPWLELYAKSLPGITGIWQVSGRNDLAYERRIELNNWYVRNWSLWHDLVILLKTVQVVIRRQSAS
jgi:undecaprenyl-phosphate galactose phosphotransferase